MLEIKVPITPELWDPVKEEFIEPVYTTLRLEHSLVSISKWESKWCKSFLSSESKTDEEIKDYVRCMTLTQNVDPSVYDKLSKENEEEIAKYIQLPLTATTFNENKKSQSREVITSELIYYWMIISGVPFECQKWPIQRLLALLRVCEVKNSGNKKMSRNEVVQQNRDLNAERRAKMKSKG